MRETVGAAAYRLLREAILTGQIEMGTRINELELATAWNVSRTPIRDALRRLEAEGLVQAVPGRGVVVPVLSLADVDELYEIREVLEARAARRAATAAGPELQARLNGLIRAFGATLKAADVDRMIAIDDDIHAAVAAASGNTRLERAIAAARAQVHPITQRGFRVRGRAAKSLREMAKLVAAIRARDAVRAEAAMREHLVSLRADLGSVFSAPD
ncbi:MAG: GntR family transcriptional regulator [Armatimonadota bacterium]|nr:GntR family transcriptional regulator [Armatimonadota bacterium]